MTRLFAILLLLVLSAIAMADEQSRLIAEKLKELDELNRQVVKQLGDLSNYDNKTIYVKARIIPQGDSKYKIKFEKVSTEKIESADPVKGETFIVVTGKITQDKTRTFKLELEDALPPPDDSSENKQEPNNHNAGEEKK